MIPIILNIKVFGVYRLTIRSANCQLGPLPAAWMDSGRHRIASRQISQMIIITFRRNSDTLKHMAAFVSYSHRTVGHLPVFIAEIAAQCYRKQQGKPGKMPPRSLNFIALKMEHQ